MVVCGCIAEAFIPRRLDHVHAVGEIMRLFPSRREGRSPVLNAPCSRRQRTASMCPSAVYRECICSFLATKDTSALHLKRRKGS
jgi:hypothetical protein